MIIETRPYDFTAKDLFRLTLRAYFVRQGWGYIVAAVVIIIATILSGRDAVEIVLLIIFAVVVLIGIPFYWVRRYALDPSRQHFLGRRRGEFSAIGLRLTSNKGSAFVEWNDVMYVSRTSSYYLFFVDAMQFFYVPFASFKEEADRARLDEFLQQRKLI